jgi:hypothetical protein
MCNTQIDLFIYYHYMFRPFFGHHRVNKILVFVNVYVLFCVCEQVEDLR